MGNTISSGTAALRTLGLGSLCFLIASSPLCAGDWPQWRFDANRSAATDEAGPEDPVLLWQRDFGQPDPAYDHQYRMCADVTHAPVAAEGLVFVPSSVSDQVLACDLETGEPRWRRFAEGPVRFAPVYREGRVYFVSDDGYLYCVAAGDGTLLWKIRGAPESLPDSRMLVNGRFCSRWPCRGAPVEHCGTIYFGAGIWPEEGVFVAAVDAESGRLLWRSDALSYVKQGMSDHGRAYDLSLPPQGYLAVIDGKLAVPSGRALAAWFDPGTGKMEPYTCFYVKTNPPRGTWYAAGIDRYCVQGGNWFGTRADALRVPPELREARSAIFRSRETLENERYVIEHRPFLKADAYRLHNENLYTEPALTPAAAYASEFTDEAKYLVPRGHTRVALAEFDRIVARDLTRPRWTTAKQIHLTYGRQQVSTLRLEFPVLWELASPLRVLVKAGDRLYAGGRDTIATVAIPKPGEKPRIAWQAAIEGTPVCALVADGKLVVAADNGQLYCFGSKTSGQPCNGARAATRSTQNGGAPGGRYACLIGHSTAERAILLAREETYRVVVFQQDPKQAAELRHRLAEEGAHGRQVQVVEASPATAHVAPYWASLACVDSPEKVGPPEKVLSAALDYLRPYGGQLVLQSGRPHANLLERLLAERSGYAMQIEADSITVRRDLPPDGADAWSHEAGGAANCFANSDRLVRWPLGVLWYSGDVDRYFTPAEHFQHQRQPYPLVVGGRMFLITGQELHAIDVYTGRYLWKAEMPMTPWVRTRLFDSRVYGRPTERNCVAATDWVYAVTGEEIRAYDAADGRMVKVFDVPPPFADSARAMAGKAREERYMGVHATIQAAPCWTEVRLCEDLLLTVLGQTLVAVDRHTGEIRWSRPSTRQTTTYAIGGRVLFGLDCDLPSGGRRGIQPEGLLFALDTATGKVAWDKPLEYAPLPEQEVEHPRLWLAPVLPELAYNAKHCLLVMSYNRNSVAVFQAADGSPVWSKSNPAGKDVGQVYSPVVTDDYLLLSNYQGCFGYLLDVRTGKEIGENSGIPRPRTCARILGNNDLLVYRDAATEFYDIRRNRMIGLNSVRSGCTTSFIPADGVMTAPMLGHGCVCNYPMFASLGLYHCPELEQYRPASVTRSWVNQLETRTPTGP